MKKVVNVNEWLHTRQNEAYDGNMADFRYEFPMHFENATGNDPSAIKKIEKKGKGYEVRTFTYMSEPEMKAVGDEMGLKLVSYKKDTSVAVTVYESVKVNEARSINKIQKDYAAAVSQMAEVVVNWKEAKASGDAKAEAGFLGQLKDLTVKKKGFERELDAFVMGKDKDAELAGVLEALLTEAKFKAGQVWLWKNADGDKEVEVVNVKPNGDVVGRVKGTSQDFIVRDASKYLKKKISESLDENFPGPGESVNEGQFSWMTQDTEKQIGSEKQNTITVYMFSDKGEKWEEKRYEGYGEFGGKDYYELLAQMNGVENADRQDGIDIAFKKKVKGKVLFPALVQDPKFNWKRHDFTQEPESDPNQSWYKERSRGFF